MDFEKVKEKAFEDAHKGNVDQVIKAVEEHLKLLKEVDVVRNFMMINFSFLHNQYKNLTLTIKPFIYYCLNIIYDKILLCLMSDD